ncbi:hypothetical protein HGRIS_000110 [Hohenbuehelia grisea]|uniref:UBC core domain-containing protein n=1 Tax=Hohenbuehelia grisea TaxID=104357 RepID=A0ABR3JQ30_9AGAR
MAPKRRIKVAFDDVSSTREVKRQRKIIVAVDEDAKIEDLAQEIRETLHYGDENILLAIDGEFELRQKDTVSVIQDNETVHVVLSGTGTTSTIESSANNVADAPTSEVKTAHLEGACPYSVKFVSAELARQHAKATLKEASQPTNGISAFNGHNISGNTSLGTLRREAARVLGWAEDAMDVDDKLCNHSKECACSCPISLRVEQSSIFSTLHCRFSINGDACGNASCPYSHAKLNESSTSPPHCSICLEALGFPCPRCIARANSGNVQFSAQLHCPLVQNAGCNHLHHSHCLGTRDDATVKPCPAGCPVTKIQREATIMDAAPGSRFLVIVWDGDKIDRIPVPDSALSPDEVPDDAAFVCVTTPAVMKLVEDFFGKQHFRIPGLSLRIRGRDPITETVRFTQSTLVSVCSAKHHDQYGYKRFPLFEASTLTINGPNEGLAPRNSVTLIDLHTSSGPIVACNCTRLSELFPVDDESIHLSLTFYAINRMYSGDQSGLRSKQNIFLVDNCWQPSTVQSNRGMVALLSSLYLLAHSVSHRGDLALRRVLSVFYAICRFPPAVRALGILLMNQSPSQADRAALSESLFQCLREFASTAPTAIATEQSRLFEVSRILLGHLASAMDSKPSASSDPSSDVKVLEELTLICAVSHKRLIDPVAMDGTVVNRTLRELYDPGSALYKPISTHLPSDSAKSDLQALEDGRLYEALARLRASSADSTMLLHIELLGQPPSTRWKKFAVAIKLANKTDLVTRGPLELKSTAIVAPQIVLDSDGLLAVFTGRGCGSTRDVNFFRPMNGGDTAVDVNDVAHALQAVVQQRLAEDTWQIDSYEGVSVVSNRPPDEAIILCLDLSESMNRSSGIGKSGAGEEKHFDHVLEAAKLVSQYVDGLEETDILQTAKSHLDAQTLLCRRIWKSFTIQKDQTAGEEDEIYHDLNELVSELGTLAARQALAYSHEVEGTAMRYHDKQHMAELCRFVSAAMDQREALETYLKGLLDELSDVDDSVLGFEPFDVPAEFTDPKTGDLLMDPVKPLLAPTQSIFANASTIDWLNSLDEWPFPYLCETSFLSCEAIKTAIEDWVAGTELLPKGSKKGKGKSAALLEITLRHGSDYATWHLPRTTTTRILYSLANRATRAKYQYFGLRLCGSRSPILNSQVTTLGVTDLSQGGTIELYHATPHQRSKLEVAVESRIFDTTPFVLPRDASALALRSAIHAWTGMSLSDTMLWHGVKNSGDGQRSGTLLDDDSDKLQSYAVPVASTVVSFECNSWFWTPSGAQRKRENSKKFSRLDLLKELFNVFLNRAASFDTSVSLVLGLVTFSNQVHIAQELSPVFENFRQQLDRVHASGDTAIYDALEAARRQLINYRPELKTLRRRIIIVTDGQDTSSTTSAKDTCYALQRDHIVVDSVQVGGHSDRVLHAISVATGGYRLSPNTSLSDALSIFDLETMLFSGERPSRGRLAPVTTDLQLAYFARKDVYPVDIVTVDKFPQRAPHDKMKEIVKPAAKTMMTHNSAKDDRTKRIMKELKVLVADPHPQIDLYVNEQDITFLKVILEAPKDIEGCPYKGGCFLLTCEFPPGYPRDPPEIRFVTFILHPNVSKQGKVCVAELGRLWSSDITVKELLSLVYGLLLEPDLDNPLEIQASLKYYDDDGTYALAAANAVTEHASKTREEWKHELEPDE